MSDLRSIPLGLRIAVPNWHVADTTERDALRYRYAGAQINAADIGCVARVGTAAPYAYYVLESVNPLVWGSLGGGGAVSFGTTAGTSCEGNDARLWPTASSASATKLGALPDAATLSTSLAGKASVEVEKGFKKSGARTLTASGTAIANDVGAAVDMNAVAANTFTIPNGIGAVDEVITVLYRGAGVGTIVAGANVQINPRPGLTLVTLGQWSWVQLVKRVTGATDIWMVTGDLVGS